MTDLRYISFALLLIAVGCTGPSLTQCRNCGADGGTDADSRQPDGSDHRAPADGGNEIAQVVAGHEHMCILGTNGEVCCWGDNTNGQLGNGTTQPTEQSVLVTGLG